MALIVAGRSFAGISEVADEARRILNAATPGVAIGDSDRDFITEVLTTFHPQGRSRLAGGITEIQVGFGGGRTSTRYFQVVKQNRSKVQMSLTKTFDHLPDRRTVLQAMRQSIAYQVAAFKDRYFKLYGRAGRAPCDVTLSLISWDDADVDHQRPRTFVVLVDEFLARENVDVLSIRIRDGKLVDRGFRARWQAFHEQNADLRIVSHQEHTRINLIESRLSDAQLPEQPVLCGLVGSPQGRDAGR